MDAQIPVPLLSLDDNHQLTLVVKERISNLLDPQTLALGERVSTDPLKPGVYHDAWRTVITVEGKRHTLIVVMDQGDHYRLKGANEAIFRRAEAAGKLEIIERERPRKKPKRKGRK